MDEKLFFLSTTTDVETELNKTFYSSSLGLLRGLVFFWGFGVVGARLLLFLFPSSVALSFPLAQGSESSGP